MFPVLKKTSKQTNKQSHDSSLKEQVTEIAKRVSKDARVKLVNAPFRGKKREKEGRAEPEQRRKPLSDKARQAFALMGV